MKSINFPRTVPWKPPLSLTKLPGHVYEFDLFPSDLDYGELLHRHAYYTVNEILKH